MATHQDLDYTFPNSFRGIAIDAIGKYASPVSVNFDERIMGVIRDLRKLKANWDGYGAAPIDPIVIKNTIDFFEMLPLGHRYALDREDITPSSHGTVSLEWSNETNNFLAIEIGKKTLGSFSTTLSGASINTMSMADLPSHIDTISSLLDKLLD